MSLVDKIPPLVSALAFGYGVGMAAPDHTLASVQTAVIGAAPSEVRPRATMPLPASPQLHLAASIPGGESALLAELRSLRAEARQGLACDHERYPGESRLRRQSSVDDDDAYVDDDELDRHETAALSRLQLPDVPLSMSKQTLKYVRHFTRSDRGRGLFETWLKRSGRFQEMIQAELRSRRLPEDLIWVAMIESGFDPTARSPAGAVGLWQFMPATGAVYGLKQTPQMDLRRNPRLATQAAAHHLRDLYVRFGDWNLALAAYNMGYEQLLDRIDRYGTADFNELVHQGALPKETSKYVPKIAAAALVANNLEKFGFDHVELGKPWDGAEVPVPARTKLSTLAKAAGVPTATIKKLNPDILGDSVPRGKGDFLVLVPPESVSRAMAALPAMLKLDGAVGEDLADPFALLGARDPSSTSVNERAVDDDASLLALLPKPKKKRRTLRDPLLEADDAIAEEEGRPTSRTQRQTLMYRVGPGDTLSGVARQFAIDVEDVARQNGLDPDGKLREGALLELSVRRQLLDEKAAGGSARAEDDAAPRRSRTKKGGSAKRPASDEG
jgi:membrane-bound lytic murein transglycosylase D